MRFPLNTRLIEDGHLKDRRRNVKRKGVFTTSSAYPLAVRPSATHVPRDA